MFAAARKVASMDRALRAGIFEPMDGIELAGKTLGIVGTGGIGKEMIRLGSALGMKVIAWNRSGLAGDLPATFVELDDLLGQADVVSLHLALNDETKGMIDRKRLNLLKKNAILVNTARGAVLDEAVLVDLLEAERIAHAALDVFEDEPIQADHPLARLANTTLDQGGLRTLAKNGSRHPRLRASARRGLALPGLDLFSYFTPSYPSACRRGQVSLVHAALGVCSMPDGNSRAGRLPGSHGLARWQ